MELRGSWCGTEGFLSNKIINYQGKIENFSGIRYRNQEYSRILSDVHTSLILALGVSLKVKSSRQTQLDPAENSLSEKNVTLTPEKKSVPRFTRLRIDKPEKFISDLILTPKVHVLK